MCFKNIDNNQYVIVFISDGVAIQDYSIGVEISWQAD
jgi:hypothetical protein